MRQAFFLSLALPLLSLIIHYLSRFVAFFSFFPLAISTRVVYNYLHMAG